jgi:alkylhydroperoxidase/carboxymuconolactone decarboxylase family protein YurZ
LIKTIATIIDFTKEEIFNAIANVEIRKQWDTLFSEFKIVEQNKDEKSEVLYMSLKVKFKTGIFI